MAVKLDPKLLGRLIAWVYRLWCATLRYEPIGQEALAAHQAQGRRLVYCLWHDELFALTGFGIRQQHRLVTVVSQSKDGEFLAQIINRLGYATARGSSRRGGLQAMREAIQLMRDDRRDAVITVDGPKGPRHKPKEGAIYIASKIGGLIVPVRLVMHTRFVFTKSWDRFQLPLPFSRVTIHFGEAYAPREGKLDAAAMAEECTRLEERLGALV